MRTGSTKAATPGVVSQAQPKDGRNGRRFSPAGTAGRRDQLWYYRSLVEVIGVSRPPGQLLGQLEAQVTELEALVAARA